jgi:hypothetical protein
VAEAESELKVRTLGLNAVPTISSFFS